MLVLCSSLALYYYNALKLAFLLGNPQGSQRRTLDTDSEIPGWCRSPGIQNCAEIILYDYNRNGHFLAIENSVSYIYINEISHKIIARTNDHRNVDS